MKIDYSKLDKRVLELKDELIADIQAWVAVPSVQAAPVDGKPYGEANARMLDLALETARKYGFKTRNIDYYAGDNSVSSKIHSFGVFLKWQKNPGQNRRHQQQYEQKIICIKSEEIIDLPLGSHNFKNGKNKLSCPAPNQNTLNA